MELNEKLLLLQKACNMCGNIEYVKAIEHYMKNISNPIKIMIVGEGKHGKSTLLNALLGRKVAKEGYGIKTANLNYYKNITSRECVSNVSFEGPFLYIENEKELNNYYEAFQKKKDANAYWLLHLEWPQSGIIVVDTEGFNQVNTHYMQGKSNISFIKGLDAEYHDLFDEIYMEADIIIWCVKGTDVGSTIEKYNRVRIYNKPIFLVYTCADEDIDDEETLSEISTIEDLKSDMRNRLGFIAKECIKDFAGFAGDRENLKRKEDFISELRKSIDDYIGNCKKGVKIEIGERLYEGIYEQILQHLCNKTEQKYTLLNVYYNGLDKIKNKIQLISKDYIQKIIDSLDELNASIDHYSYDIWHKECGHDADKSFAKIELFYDHIFMEHEVLHQLIDVELPQKMKLMQDEFLLYADHIVDNHAKNIEFSVLWKKQKEEFKKLKSNARGWGIIATWVPRKFKNYFETLKSDWRKIINAELEDIKLRYEIGFKFYLSLESYGSFEKFASNLIIEDAICQMLEKIENENIFSWQDYYLYGFKSLSELVGIYGEHNTIYQRVASDLNILPDVEELLMMHYIEEDFKKYEEQINKHFTNVDIEKNAEKALQILEEHCIKDIINIPQKFHKLSGLMEKRLYFEDAVNFKRESVEKYYLQRVKLLEKYYELQKERVISIANTIMLGEVRKWMTETIFLFLESEFIEWKLGFEEYLAHYKIGNKFKAICYYNFFSFLERSNSKFKELYISDRNEMWEVTTRELLFKEQPFSDKKQELILQELKIYLSELDKRINSEVKQQRLYIAEANGRIFKEEIEEWLKQATCIANKISSLQLIKIESYEGLYEIKKKIGECGINDVEKTYLIGSYKAISEKLFGEVCNLQLYGDVEQELEKHYEHRIKEILLSIKK